MVIPLPAFKNYEEEATFWDNFDTSDFMPDDDEWIHFDTDKQFALRVALLSPQAYKRMPARDTAHKEESEVILEWIE